MCRIYTIFLSGVLNIFSSIEMLFEYWLTLVELTFCIQAMAINFEIIFEKRFVNKTSIKFSLKKINWKIDDSISHHQLIS